MSAPASCRLSDALHRTNGGMPPPRRGSGCALALHPAFVATSANDFSYPAQESTDRLACQKSCQEYRQSALKASA